MAEDAKFHEQAQHAGRWGALWWTVSIVLHLTIVFCLVYFTPLRKFFFAKQTESPLADIRGARVSKMVKSILDVQTQRLREKVQQQKDLLLEMESARDNRYERYAQERKYMLARGGVKDLPPLEPRDVMGSPGPEVAAQVKDLGFAELYDAAQQIEKRTYGLYRQFRAAELARLQYLSLSVAFDASKMAIPEHPAVNFDFLYLPVESAMDANLQRIKDELQKVQSEVASMVAAAQRMFDLAKELMGDDVGNTAGYGTGGSGPTGGGGDGDADPTRARKEIFSGYSPPAPDAFQHAWGVGVGPVVHKNELYPSNAGADLGKVPPAPGRKLAASGIKANWMYIDTWYIVGPFPNPNRENLDKKFPPEAGLDLDATYVGMNGRRLKWEYRQSYTVCVFPHVPDNYTIYYAYTEIHSDREQDRWCIFGSDDYGKAWMNEELIYASGITPHPWIPDRAYKKVHFKKGANKLLFKLENAWGRTGFSMCVYMGEL